MVVGAWPESAAKMALRIGCLVPLPLGVGGGKDDDMKIIDAVGFP
jgi:hypothetical protein